MSIANKIDEISNKWQESKKQNDNNNFLSLKTLKQTRLNSKIMYNSILASIKEMKKKSIFKLINGLTNKH